MSANYLLDKVLIDNANMAILTEATNNFTAKFYEKGGLTVEHPIEDCSIDNNDCLVITLNSESPPLNSTVKVPNGSWCWAVRSTEHTED